MAIIEAVGNPRVATSFLSYTAVGSTENANFVASNITALDRPKKTWRSTALGAQNIVLDFGSAKTPPAIFLDNVNFATVQIQGNATDSWGTPAFDTGSVTIDEDPQIDRYKKLVTLTSFNYRFMRILIPSQTPVDGAAYYQIGAAAVPVSLTTLTEAPTYPGEWKDIGSIVQNDFLSGGFETIPLGSGKAKTVTINFKVSSDDAVVKQIYDLLGDRDRIILFDFNLTVSWESYLCKVLTDLQRQWPSAAPIEFPSIEMRVFT